MVGSGLLSSCLREKKRELTVLHTNDMHSHIEPFPKDHPDHPGEGGMARRAALIDGIRKEVGDLLLLDAGDIFQGTPYFNVFDGELEFKLMSTMGYDAATMGNHDFDKGPEGFDRMLPHADFPFITTNYDLSETPLAGKTHRSELLERKHLRIGIVGAGIELKGLVSPSLIGGVRYLDPIQECEREARSLKKDKSCDMVIALSHLGYRYEQEKVCDEDLARESGHIDLILGGHTHTFFPKAKVYKNQEGKPVIINQVGWAGLRLGRIDLEWRGREGAKRMKTLNLPL